MRAAHFMIVRSVANSTRQDARELLRNAALVPVVSRVQEYDLEQANEALLDIKEDRVRGSATLRVATDLSARAGSCQALLSVPTRPLSSCVAWGPRRYNRCTQFLRCEA